MYQFRFTIKRGSCPCQDVGSGAAFCSKSCSYDFPDFSCYSLGHNLELNQVSHQRDQVGIHQSDLNFKTFLYLLYQVCYSSHLLEDGVPFPFWFNFFEMGTPRYTVRSLWKFFLDISAQGPSGSKA